jgi:hypothetical protein
VNITDYVSHSRTYFTRADKLLHASSCNCMNEIMKEIKRGAFYGLRIDRPGSQPFKCKRHALSSDHGSDKCPINKKIIGTRLTGPRHFFPLAVDVFMDRGVHSLLTSPTPRLMLIALSRQLLHAPCQGRGRPNRKHPNTSLRGDLPGLP